MFESADVTRRGSVTVLTHWDLFRRLDVRKVCEFIRREKQCESAPMNSRGEQSLSLTRNSDQVMTLIFFMFWESILCFV